MQASNTNRGAGAGAESNKTSDHNTTKTAYNAGLTDLKLEKSSVVVSGREMYTSSSSTPVQSYKLVIRQCFSLICLKPTFRLAYTMYLMHLFANVWILVKSSLNHTLT